jgi:hypothetical protein
VKYLPAALFGSSCAAAVAYCYPHYVGFKLQREIIRNNEQVTAAIREVKAEQPPEKADPNTGLFGYM